jgi:hypothetical protein
VRSSSLLCEEPIVRSYKAVYEQLRYAGSLIWI